MIGPDNQYVMKVVEQLEEENLFSSYELSLMEDYLCGNAEDEVLEKFDYHDLSHMAKLRMVRKLYEMILMEGWIDQAKRLENLLFAIGEASGYQIFSPLVYRMFGEQISMEPAKKAVLHAALIGDNISRMGKSYFQNLIADAENQPEHLKKAMEYRTGTASNGMLILLTAYFYVKYPIVEKEMELDGEDAALMKRYEDLVTGSIPKMYLGNLPKQDMDKIMAAVTQARLSRSILDLAEGHGNIDRFWLCMLVCTAFVNHGLSLILKNVVSICLAAGCETALNYIEKMDLRGI